MNYRFLGKTLITNMFEISFEHNINKVILHDGVFVTELSILDANGMTISGIERNIYGVSLSGEIVWRIPNPSMFFSIAEPGWDSIFYNCKHYSESTFSATTPGELECIFDYRTGTLLGCRRLRFGMPYSDEFIKI